MDAMELYDKATSKEAYKARHDRLIAIEREMDALTAAGVPETDERHTTLYSEWQNLEYLNNAL